MLVQIITYLNWCILWYFIGLSSVYILLLALSIPDIRLRFKETYVSKLVSAMKSNSMPPVTAIIPAFNERQNILETVDSLLKMTYTNTYILIINASSTDDTLRKLIKTYDLYAISPIASSQLEVIGAIKGYYISRTYPNITVLDKQYKDRSDAINAGVNLCHTPLFFTIDADSLIEPNALSRIVFYMLSRPYTIAVGGAVNILNGCIFRSGKIVEAKVAFNLLYGFQTCEYMRSFLFSRSGWNALGGALCYAGTFTLFQHKNIVDIGGFQRDNAAQDFEIITHLHAYNLEHKVKYHIGYTPAAAVWTDVPGTLREYWNQRVNWQDGMLRSLMPYKKMLFNYKYGVIGLFTYPFFLFGETLSALVEFTAYILLILSWYFHILNPFFTVLFFVICWGFTVALTMATALLNFVTFDSYKHIRDLLWFLFIAIIEPFGFRQFNVICRVWATFKYGIGSLIFWKKKEIK